MPVNGLRKNKIKGYTIRRGTCYRCEGELKGRNGVDNQNTLHISIKFSKDKLKNITYFKRHTQAYKDYACNISFKIDIPKYSS